MKKIQYNSPVVLTFFFLSLFALILGYATDQGTTEVFFSVYKYSLKSPLTYLRFFTHILGHVSLDDFMENMLLLLVIGPPLEEKYGSSSLLTGILFTALASGIFQFTLFPQETLMGAGGIVFMMIMLSSLSGMREGKIPLTLIIVGLIYLGREFFSIGLSVHDTANFMHVVGGVCGTIFGLLEYKIKR